jgi:hypothetical protein
MAGIGWPPLGGEWWTWQWCVTFWPSRPLRLPNFTFNISRVVSAHGIARIELCQPGANYIGPLAALTGPCLHHSVLDTMAERVKCPRRDSGAPSRAARDGTAGGGGTCWRPFLRA